MKKLTNKKIVVTGATGGLGEPLIKLLVQENCELFLISSNAQKLDKLCTQNAKNCRVNYFCADLSSYDGIMLAADFISKINDLDIVINLAGISHFGSLGQHNPQDIAKLYNVNLLAPTILSQAALPAMTNRNCGQIVNIGSIFGSIAFGYFAAYSASKAGLRGLSESLRRELSGTKIAVTYIAPRAVKTKINEGKVTEFLDQTKTTIDDAEIVAKKILQAIKDKKTYAYFGLPESIFVRLNYILPSIVDSALKGTSNIAQKILINN